MELSKFHWFYTLFASYVDDISYVERYSYTYSYFHTVTPTWKCQKVSVLLVTPTWKCQKVSVRTVTPTWKCQKVFVGPFPIRGRVPPGESPRRGWATQCGVAIESIPVVQLLELLVQVVQLLELLVQVASSGISVAEP